MKHVIQTMIAVTDMRVLQQDNADVSGVFLKRESAFLKATLFLQMTVHQIGKRRGQYSCIYNLTRWQIVNSLSNKQF
jgi:hypothetical protein